MKIIPLSCHWVKANWMTREPYKCTIPVEWNAVQGLPPLAYDRSPIRLNAQRQVPLWLFRMLKVLPSPFLFSFAMQPLS
jgi:hypothetical protein